MPICIECRYPVPQLYHVLHSTHKPNNPTSPQPTPPNGDQKGSGIQSPASGFDLSGGSRGGGEAKPASVTGGDVRLTQCPRCKRFADKYVEHDFVVLFIDLVLVKPQVSVYGAGAVWGGFLQTSRVS